MADYKMQLKVNVKNGSNEVVEKFKSFTISGVDSDVTKAAVVAFGTSLVDFYGSAPAGTSGVDTILALDEASLVSYEDSTFNNPITQN